jgi:hypothetical protein
MKRRLASLWALTFLALFVFQLPAHAQSTAATRTSGGASPYDVSQEITLNAAVSSVIRTPSPGMVMGSHLMLATASGTVDASLGRFAFRGSNPLSVVPGDHVEVTGVWKSFNSRQVLLVRTVKVNNQMYSIRNQRGALLSPQARQRAAENGGQL